MESNPNSRLDIDEAQQVRAMRRAIARAQVVGYKKALEVMQLLEQVDRLSGEINEAFNDAKSLEEGIDFLLHEGQPSKNFASSIVPPFSYKRAHEMYEGLAFSCLSVRERITKLEQTE